ncbi:hypothetical protein GCM10007108_08320 [Thermogymnomonas acidicola]|uniref:Glycosyltransferase 2-like domain-containing protein n=1 Tax=Thermogymnomonas acidicola TaxID=399579 RepID=A0AA37BRM8_9ARCH|nr:glycosyltransferase [Thermogymnomonas acidicola]GGM72525.1 hypothetical protein GCM10007108_08320 [Thermogymnomonas acidicola]
MYDVVVRTYNSSRTLERCLESVATYLRPHRVIVVDHRSTDGTVEIARSRGAEVISEEGGLCYASYIGSASADCPTVVYVDSDVEIVSPVFKRVVEGNGGSVVVGCSTSNAFLYGIPLCATAVPRQVAISSFLGTSCFGRETYYLMRAVRRERLRVIHVPGVYVHRAYHRSNRDWPVWQGAMAAMVSGGSLMQAASSVFTSFLMLAGSRSMKNGLYFPVFSARLLWGFANYRRYPAGPRPSEPPHQDSGMIPQGPDEGQP